MFCLLSLVAANAYDGTNIPVGSDVTFIGDSIGSSVNFQELLKEKVAGTIYFNTKCGRNIPEGKAVLGRLIASPAVKDNVVIELGTNALSSSDLDILSEMIGMISDKVVVLVTPYISEKYVSAGKLRPLVEEIAEWMRSVQSPNVIIVDWNQYVKSAVANGNVANDFGLLRDGVHLRTDAEEILAGMIADALSGVMSANNDVASMIDCECSESCYCWKIHEELRNKGYTVCLVRATLNVLFGWQCCK